MSLILAPEYFLPIRAFGADYHATLNGKTAFNATQALLDHPLPPVALTSAELIFGLMKVQMIM